MSDKSHCRTERRNESRPISNARRLFGAGVEAGARAYVRARDLPRLVPLWPHELEDYAVEGTLRILAKLRRALRAERRRATSGHWSYDLNRHLGLLSAYKGELAELASKRSSRGAQAAPARDGAGSAEG